MRFPLKTKSKNLNKMRVVRIVNKVSIKTAIRIGTTIKTAIITTTIIAEEDLKNFTLKELLPMKAF